MRDRDTTTWLVWFHEGHRKPTGKATEASAGIVKGARVPRRPTVQYKFGVRCNERVVGAVVVRRYPAKAGQRRGQAVALMIAAACAAVRSSGRPARGGGPMIRSPCPSRPVGRRSRRRSQAVIVTDSVRRVVDDHVAVGASMVSLPARPRSPPRR